MADLSESAVVVGEILPTDRNDLLLRRRGIIPQKPEPPANQPSYPSSCRSESDAPEVPALIEA